MITLLLVEDEYYTRNGLLNFVTHEVKGIGHVETAEDGREGLSIARNHKIDILLTDIKMPHMDGIELARSVRVLYPECIIIFLSGYSDREYLRNALSLRTFRYIDKPVDMEIVADTLTDAVTMVRKLKDSDDQILYEQKKIMARNLAHGSANEAETLELAQNYGLQADSFSCGRCVLIRLLNDSALQAEPSDFPLVIYELINELSAYFERLHMPVLISEHKERFVLIYLLNCPQIHVSEEDLCEFITEIQPIIDPLPHFIAIGKEARGISKMCESYQTAVTHLQGNFYLGADSVSDYKSILGEPFDAEEIVIELQRAIVARDNEATDRAARQMYLEFRSHPATLISNVRATYLKLLYWMNSYLHKIGRSYLAGENYLLEKVTNSVTLETLHGFLKDQLQTYFKSEEDGQETLSGKIKAIVEECYSDSQLGVGYLCDRLNLSASYISSVFKQETGTTINSHIQNVRMRKAQEYLSTTNLKIMEIASLCGYPDSNYFTKLFHKHTGFLPSEYREVYAQ